MKKLLLWIVILLVGLGLYYGYQQQSKAPAGAAKKSAAPVRVGVVSRQDMPLEYSTFSHVQASQSVDILPRVDGQISAINVKDGQSVRKDQVLFELDDRALKAELAQAKASLAGNQASLKGARLTLERQQAMYARKASSQQNLEDARTAVLSYEAAVAADQAALSLAQTQLSYTQVKAPFDGVLGNISVDIGSTVRSSATTALVTLKSITPVQVMFALPERYFATLSESLSQGEVPVGLTLKNSTGSQTFSGKVLYIDNSIDSTSGTLPVYAEFANDDRRLWPGQFAEVTLQLAMQKNVVTAPQVALKDGPESMYAFVLQDDNTVRQTDITLDRIAGDTAIVSKGLNPGDKVITQGLISLRNGSKVRIIEDSDASSASSNKTKANASTEATAP
ncbi:efflux RND transporter periplasmic adaptor subunit [Pokkaliibacter sp. CJK22405]|uniref:efflux RND transporter periplasmic adaptor subunit n=1 Tax=Pokkaliibacter sp. CJK22405 TaxID=3384615 RepID=UPI003984C87A